MPLALCFLCQKSIVTQCPPIYLQSINSNNYLQGIFQKLNKRHVCNDFEYNSLSLLEGLISKVLLWDLVRKVRNLALPFSGDRI